MFTKDIQRFFVLIALGMLGLSQVNGMEEEPPFRVNPANKIVRVNDPNAAAILLQIFSSFRKTLEAHPDQKDSKELIIFVDVDDTLIQGASDFESFSDDDKVQPKVISPFLIKALRDIRDLAEENDIKVTILGLTSASLWRVAKQRNTNQISLLSPRTKVLLKDGKFIMSSVPDDLDLSSVRIQAMESIGVPFTVDEQQPLKGLPFLQGFHSPTISPECKTEGPLQFTFPLTETNSTEIFKFTRGETNAICFKQDDIFIEIRAFPVLHKGIISMNCGEPSDGLYKGKAIASYLIDRFPYKDQDLSKLICIVAIDDNPMMLDSISQVCEELDIIFQGINIYHEQKPKDDNKEKDK